MKKVKSKSKISRKKTVSRKSIPRKSSEILVTQGMLLGVRNELIEKMDAMDSRLTGKMDSGFHALNAKMDRFLVLMEEQNARNKPVLEALHGIMERQDRLEDDQKELRSILTRPKDI